LVLSGCIVTEALLTEVVDKHVDRWIHESTLATPDPAFKRRLMVDADQYVDQLERPLELTKRQVRLIEETIVRRGLALSRRSSAYPFPRSNRPNLKEWWAETDQAIARHLNHRQRAAYYGGYSLHNARYEDRGRRGRGKDPQRGRGHDRRDDRDWDDDGWDD
jgi:hypothetical protein